MLTMDFLMKKRRQHRFFYMIDNNMRHVYLIKTISDKSLLILANTNISQCYKTHSYHWKLIYNCHFLKNM